MSGKEDYCVYEMPCTEMIEPVAGNNLGYVQNPVEICSQP